MNGWIEPQSTRDARTLRRVLNQDAINLYLSITSEAEADRVHELIAAAEWLDVHPVDEAQAISAAEKDTDTTEAAEISKWLGSDLTTKSVVMVSRPRNTVSREWAKRHLNVEDNGLEAALDKSFGAGNWQIG